MKKYLTIVLSLFMTLTVAAQNNSKAESILSEVQSKISAYGTFKVAFSINGEKASIEIKGNMFRMKSPGVIIWFNGDEQWTYIEESNEVNLTNPDNSELNAINPYHFLKNWKTTCSCAYKGEKNIKGSKNRIVELKNKNASDFDCINIFVTPENEISGMTIKDANGDEFNIDINKIEKNLSIDDNAFEFDEKKYSNAEIIDLR